MINTTISLNFLNIASLFSLQPCACSASTCVSQFLKVLLINGFSFAGTQAFLAEKIISVKETMNQLKNEYFKRVNFANRNFTAFGTEGWLTDRGRILIKFGYPDDIERHPFDMNSKPYEIWRYYNLRKVFLFVDRTGFGDYRLHPDYIDMEYR